MKLTVRVVLDKDGDILGRFGELIGRLLSRSRPQVYAVVLQDLIGTAEADLEGRRVHFNGVHEDPDSVTANLLFNRPRFRWHWIKKLQINSLYDNTSSIVGINSPMAKVYLLKALA